MRQNRNASELFSARLREEREEKARVAEYFIRLIESEQTEPSRGHSSTTLFLESGSTIAAAMEALADLSRACQGDHWLRDSKVITNNSYGAGSLADLVGEFSKLPGRLDEKYSAWLPFVERDGCASTDPAPAEAAGECGQFEALVDELTGADIAAGSSSDLSLLVGPLVGSYANNLFKRALFAAYRRRAGGQKLYWLGHFRKLVGTHDGPGRLKMAYPNPDTCGCTFLPDDRVARYVQDPEWLSVDAGSLRRQWHCLYFQGGHRSLPVRGFIRARDKYSLSSGPDRIEESWLRCAPGLEILVGMPVASDVRESAQAWLDLELEETNQLLAAIEDPLRYEVIATDPTLAVTHIVARRATTATLGQGLPSPDRG